MARVLPVEVRGQQILLAAEASARLQHTEQLSRDIVQLLAEQSHSKTCQHRQLMRYIDIDIRNTGTFRRYCKFILKWPLFSADFY